MLRSLLLILLSTAGFLSVNAEEAADGLARWAEAMPETVDGVKIYTPELQNEKIQISDLADVEGVAKSRIFANVMLAVRETMNDETDEIENVDYDSFRIRFSRSSANENLPATFLYSVALQMDDGMLSFLVYDISISYRERGIIPRTQKIEKLNPEGNRRHKELFESFVVDAARYIDSLLQAARADQALEVTHWAELSQGKVVKGMNPTEVKMLRGRPDSERQSGQRLKWMYGNENVVVFTDGVVTTVL